MVVVIRKGPQGGKYYVKNGKKVYVPRSTRTGKKSSKHKSSKRRSKSGKKPGGSNVGRYKGVSKNLFCGPAGGAPRGSYPCNTRARCISAKSYARYSPNPAGIKRCADRIARKKGWMGKDGKIKRSTKKRKSTKRKR